MLSRTPRWVENQRRKYVLNTATSVQIPHLYRKCVVGNLDTNFVLKNFIKSTCKARYEPCIPMFKLPKAITLRPADHYDRKREENKIVPVHVMKAYRGNTDITPLILNLCATRR